MNRTEIDWPGLTHSWNPVIGCQRGCSYCYARDLHNKRHKAHLEGKKLPEQYDLPFEAIQYVSARLEDRDLNRQAPSVVFVGSMTDIAYWDDPWKKEVIDVCRKHARHTFMFLTKDPDSYAGQDWPKNTMQGLTLTGSEPHDKTMEYHKKMMELPRPYLSVEPLLGYLKPCAKLDRYEVIIVGGMTGVGRVKPKREWIDSVKENTYKEKVYWKQNIRRYL